MGRAAARHHRDADGHQRDGSHEPDALAFGQCSGTAPGSALELHTAVVSEKPDGADAATYRMSLRAETGAGNPQHQTGARKPLPCQSQGRAAAPIRSRHMGCAFGGRRGSTYAHAARGRVAGITCPEVDESPCVRVEPEDRLAVAGLPLRALEGGVVAAVVEGVNPR